MQVREVCLASSWFLLALCLLGQPAEAAVSPPSSPKAARSHGNHWVLYLPYSLTLAREVKINFY